VRVLEAFRSVYTGRQYVRVLEAFRSVYTGRQYVRVLGAFGPVYTGKCLFVQLASAHKFLMGEVNTHHHLQAMAEEPAETVAELLQQDDGQDYDLDEAPGHQPQGHSGRQPRAHQPARRPAPYHQYREGLSNLKMYQPYNLLRVAHLKRAFPGGDNCAADAHKEGKGQRDHTNDQCPFQRWRHTTPQDRSYPNTASVHQHMQQQNPRPTSNPLPLQQLQQQVVPNSTPWQGGAPMSGVMNANVVNTFNLAVPDAGGAVALATAIQRSQQG